MKKEILDRTESFVREYLSGVESGHNWWHIHRVRNTAIYIHAREQQGDAFTIEMAALLHDIGDYKVKNGRKKVDLKVFLDGLKLETKQIDIIINIIDHISFRAGFGPDYEHFAELDIVQDADRLDAIGAIGIARAFNYGGSKGNEIYDPEQEPRNYKSADEYTRSDSSTINHFYEKLLRLKDLMNTQTGRALAESRHRFMEDYLEQFYREWNTG